MRLRAIAASLVVLASIAPRCCWAEPTVAQLWKARALEALDRLKNDKRKGPIGYEATVEFAYAAHVAGDSLRKVYDGGETYHLLFKSDEGLLDVAFIYSRGARLPSTIAVYRLPKGWVAAASELIPGQLTIGTEDAMLTFDLKDPFKVTVSMKDWAAKPTAKGRKCMEGDRSACVDLRALALVSPMKNSADQRIALSFLRGECDKLGECGYLGVALLWAQETEAAKSAFYRACALDDASACSNLVSLLDQEKESEVSKALREKVCRLDARLDAACGGAASVAREPHAELGEVGPPRQLKAEQMCALVGPDTFTFQVLVTARHRPTTPETKAGSVKLYGSSEGQLYRTLWQVLCEPSGCSGFSLGLDDWEAGKGLAVAHATGLLPSSLTRQFHPTRNVVTLQVGPWRTFTIGLADKTLRYSEVADGYAVEVEPITCR